MSLWQFSISASIAVSETLRPSFVAIATMRPRICCLVGRVYTSSRQWPFSVRSFCDHASLQMQTMGTLDVCKSC